MRSAPVIRRERLQIGKFSLYYERIGEGRPLLFLHGLGGNHLSWWQQVPFFMRWYECITVDQRGFGLSPDTDGTFNDAHSSDLSALLDHLKIDKAVLIGQSMGGWTIVGCALKNPGRFAGMVMAGTIGGIFTPQMQPHFSLAGMVMSGTISGDSAPQVQPRSSRPAPLRPGVESPIGSLPTYASDYVLRRPDKTFLYDEIRLLGAQPPADGMARIGGLRHDLAEAREKLRMPILCVVGEQDTLMPPEVIRMLAGQLPNARLALVPDCGHSTYFEQPEIFNQNVLEFLRAIDYAG